MSPSHSSPTSELLTSFNLPLWSIALSLSVAAMLVYTKNLLHVSKSSPLVLCTVNEFLFSIVWVILSLETVLISNMWSKASGLAFLGFRLLLLPLLVQDVSGNPCLLLYNYLHTHPPLRNGSFFIYSIIAQAFAVPIGIIISILLWQLLATVSNDHFHFLEMELNHFLSVTPLTGVIIEISVTFLMFMPGIFFTESVIFRIFNVLFVISLISLFGVLTGAFMNPMVAFACLFMWHSKALNVWELGVFLQVFCLGPMVGTVMAVGVAGLKSKLSAKRKHLD